MEREQYISQIRELLGAVQSLLDANKSMGEKLNNATAKLDQANIEIANLREYTSSLELKIKDLEGKNASHKRVRFAGNTETSSALIKPSRNGKTKD